MESKSLYAVYGTLRKKGSNHRYLDNNPNVKFVGSITTDPIFNLKSVSDAFPALLKKGNTSVVMEIYDVASAQVETNLDRLEGYSLDAPAELNYYQKDIIDTPLGPAYVYFWNEKNPSKLSNITSGDWIDYITVKTKENEK
tara:strand:- start:62 stop:484 length:423 start_codon:yes stop_codon:yes gene_type:complete